MNARKRPRPGVGGCLFLDNEGIMRATEKSPGGEMVRARLEAARIRGARVATSAVVLAEIIRGEPRDARVHRILNKIKVEDVTPEIGIRAGELIGTAGLHTDQSVDAALAATATLYVERHERLGHLQEALIITSDLPHLSKLTEGHNRVRVAHVDRLPGR
ncbi:hypothetical protein GCM10009800_10980 [Nocardiopsis rhodophaea]